MKRKVKVLVAAVTLVAVVLIASRCDGSSSGSPYGSAQYGSAMKASGANASPRPRSKSRTQRTPSMAPLDAGEIDRAPAGPAALLLAIRKTTAPTQKE
jgi:hypothetical protein